MLQKKKKIFPRQGQSSNSSDKASFGDPEYIPGPAILGQEVRGSGMGMAFELPPIAFLYSEIRGASPFYSPICSKLWSLLWEGTWGPGQISWLEFRGNGYYSYTGQQAWAHSGRHGIHCLSNIQNPRILSAWQGLLSPLLTPLHKLTWCMHTRTHTQWVSHVPNRSFCRRTYHLVFLKFSSFFILIFFSTFWYHRNGGIKAIQQMLHYSFGLCIISFKKEENSHYSMPTHDINVLYVAEYNCHAPS